MGDFEADCEVIPDKDTDPDPAVGGADPAVGGYRIYARRCRRHRRKRKVVHFQKLRAKSKLTYEQESMENEDPHRLVNLQERWECQRMRWEDGRTDGNRYERWLVVDEARLLSLIE